MIDRFLYLLVRLAVILASLKACFIYSDIYLISLLIISQAESLNSLTLKRNLGNMFYYMIL